MAPVEDNDSGMESQEGSQALDDTLKEDDFTSTEKKQPEIEAADEDEVLEFPLNAQSACN